MHTEWVRWFDDLTLDDLAIVGGKNASLGELRRELAPLGVRVPNGYATTAHAYRAFLGTGDLRETVDAALAGLDVRDLAQPREAGRGSNRRRWPERQEGDEPSLRKRPS